ncbi:hypothetical protein F53441_11597 [Fusarium austroafricanum]|uniref:FAD/NAD(P)-binding domain-containing protein n=1 Tax=Fusarium austroafricanum TaxID=2364996 RepID=A0A8H4NRX7_9HYPO|nr:hypothetical protein F53441_11597 [Fusarium austroafricanum]
MNLQQVSLYLDIIKEILSHLARLGVDKGKSIVHRYTYRASPNPRNVIVVGGSFAGCQLAQRLAQTLPSGYRVVLIEKHTHFNYAFGFPRNVVFSGREHHAFIPYDNIAAGAPDGILHQICDEASEVTDTHVHTVGGVSVAYDYLVIATGAAQPAPARLLARSKDDGIEELRGFQQRIEKAKSVAVIGGGAVGVELVTEIKEKYPDRQVTLIHSRDQLLPRFGPKLHEHVVSVLRSQDIEVILGERPAFENDAGQSVRETNLMFATGETKSFDLVIPCTGLRPRSELLAPYSPKSIASSGEILVGPTLQIEHLPSSRRNMFAIGDVAQCGGAKQARAAMMQAEIVVKNILRLIKGDLAKDNYTPHYFENTLLLTLGKDASVMYVQKGDYEWVKVMKGSDEDLNAGRMRWQLNAKPE